jgi:hypothetical protein
LLERFGSVSAVLGGTMGRLAVIDAGIEDIIDINAKKTPSQLVHDLQASSDAIVLLNQAKNRQTGLAFGSRVAANARIIRPLIQIDYGGMFVAKLAGIDIGFAEIVAENLCLELLEWSINSTCNSHDCNATKRRLVGVFPGELISINGVVIAKAIESDIEIRVQEGKVIDIKGAIMKHQGLEKLPPLALDKAIIRSGIIRRTEASPRIRDRRGNGAAIIDHCAENAFEAAKGCRVVLTVGDDTTAIAADILSRLNIPVIGIVDGDLDKLSYNTMIPKGSIIITVEAGYDDIVGKLVKEQIFKGGNRTSFWANQLTERVMEIAGERVVHIEIF